MGRFVVSRSALGDRFMLQSNSGRTVVVSKDYANLDACKKGICSLMGVAPTAPVVDLAKGEKGKNPKFEICKAEQGGLFYFLKSANGKVVISAGPFADQKACLRAIAILRSEVVGAEVVFLRPAGLSSLTLPDTPQAAPTPTALSTPKAPPQAAPVGECDPDPVAEGVPVPEVPPKPAFTAREGMPKPPAQPHKTAAQPQRAAVQRRPAPTGVKAPPSAKTGTVRKTSFMPTVPTLQRPLVKSREMAKNKGKQLKTTTILDRFFKK